MVFFHHFQKVDGAKIITKHAKTDARGSLETQVFYMDAKKYRNFLFEDALGSILDGFGKLFCASGGSLGACWAPLGRFLGASWALLGASWVLLGASWAHLTSHGRLRARFGSLRGSISDLSALDFGALGADFGALYACVYILHELLHETLLGMHLGFSFPPCSAAVRAQHMELEPSWPFWPHKLSEQLNFHLLKLKVF